MFQEWVDDKLIPRSLTFSLVTTSLFCFFSGTITLENTVEVIVSCWPQAARLPPTNLSRAGRWISLWNVLIGDSGPWADRYQLLPMSAPFVCRISPISQLLSRLL